MLTRSHARIRRRLLPRKFVTLQVPLGPSLRMHRPIKRKQMQVVRFTFKVLTLSWTSRIRSCFSLSRSASFEQRRARCQRSTKNKKQTSTSQLGRLGVSKHVEPPPGNGWHNTLWFRPQTQDGPVTARNAGTKNASSATNTAAARQQH